jgi:hypothetical protein
MEEISMVRKVTKNGISVKNHRLLKYLNQKVRITICPVIEEKSDVDDLLEILSSFTDEDIKAFEEALADCRRIDDDSSDFKDKLPRSGARGLLKGKVWMAEDFDEPLDDLKEYM